MLNDRSSDMWNARSSDGTDRRGVRKPKAIARSASSSGGWGREGVRSEARAQLRLAPGGRAALPLTRTNAVVDTLRAMLGTQGAIYGLRTGGLSMLWAIVVLLLLLWIGGFSLQVAGS